MSKLFRLFLVTFLFHSTISAFDISGLLVASMGAVQKGSNNLTERLSNLSASDRLKSVKNAITDISDIAVDGAGYAYDVAQDGMVKAAGKVKDAANSRFTDLDKAWLEAEMKRILEQLQSIKEEHGNQIKRTAIVLGLSYLGYKFGTSVLSKLFGKDKDNANNTTVDLRFKLSTPNPLKLAGTAALVYGAWKAKNYL